MQLNKLKELDILGFREKTERKTKITNKHREIKGEIFVKTYFIIEFGKMHKCKNGFPEFRTPNSTFSM